MRIVEAIKRKTAGQRIASWEMGSPSLLMNEELKREGKREGPHKQGEGGASTRFCQNSEKGLA
jgi:hypothetical protein